MLSRGRQGRGRDRRAQATAGTALPCCTPRPPGSAASTSASCRARAASPPRRWRRAALDLLFLLGADEIDVEPRTPSSSTSAPMATAAPTAPTSSCRAPPTPRRPRPTSTPRAACSSPTAPRSRRARRARTGRSCARCPTCSASGCPTTRCAQLRAALFARPSASRHRSTPSRPADADDVRGARESRRQLRQGAVQVADRGLLSHQPDRAGVRGDGGVLGARRTPRPQAAE